ncbi:hypothetical protein ACQEV2_42605 [Streptomyces sp. CA-251387]|uniref:hypothetical protein n=1 Tax=Streptomyces sp. CA-251387 TaxID=3240064 RepID=UPI003D8A8D03
MSALFSGHPRTGLSLRQETGPLFTSVAACAIGSGMPNPLLVVYLHTVRGLPIALATSVVTVAAVVSHHHSTTWLLTLAIASLVCLALIKADPSPPHTPTSQTTAGRRQNRRT